jgi:hypothetical protein
MDPASNLLESSLSNAFKSSKLNSMNYATWSGHMKSALQSKYLWLVVTSDEDCPPEVGAAVSETERCLGWKERLDWKLRDQAAMGNLKGACEMLQILFIEKDTVTTSKEMWGRQVS